jgi:hypothetical protein
VLSKLLIALALMAVCVIVHATSLASAIRWWRPRADAADQFWMRMRIFVLVAAWVVIIHLLEIAVWGAFYVFKGAMPDIESALYFSAVTYTTTGYGDLVLPPDWRLLGAVEALTGILMCGWSTGFFFAVVSRIFEDSGRVPTA